LGEPRPYKMALAFDLQVVPRVPTDRFDISADCVLTESRRFDRRAVPRDPFDGKSL
jgi:5-formyltetrahydrofolate cyclo-ligase